MRHALAALLVLTVPALGGCAVVALPLRVTASVVEVVPVVGDIVAAPVDAVADVID